MHIARSPIETCISNLYIELPGLAVTPVFLKCEGLNSSGSIKLKTADYMITQLQSSGVLTPEKEVIESSSGNMGVALSQVCAHKGIRFTCVTDPVSSVSSRKMMEAAGARIIVVKNRDENGGYLLSRIRLIEKLCSENENLIWPNQYRSDSNWKAHYDSTAREISYAFPKVDWLFAGAGTTGTLMGCSRYFKEHRQDTRIVAVDSVGSITFGGEAGKRHIPGLGASHRPAITDERFIDEVLLVKETDTIDECRFWAKRGFLFGGSTGTILSAIRQYRDRIAKDDVVVAISPDFGGKYMDTIYDDEWVRAHYASDATPAYTILST